MVAPLAPVAGEAAELPDSSAILCSALDLVRIALFEGGFLAFRSGSTGCSTRGSGTAVRIAVGEPALISIRAISFLPEPVHALQAGCFGIARFALAASFPTRFAIVAPGASAFPSPVATFLVALDSASSFTSGFRLAPLTESHSPTSRRTFPALMAPATAHIALCIACHTRCTAAVMCVEGLSSPAIFRICAVVSGPVQTGPAPFSLPR